MEERQRKKEEDKLREKRDKEIDELRVIREREEIEKRLREDFSLDKLEKRNL